MGKALISAYVLIYMSACANDSLRPTSIATQDEPVRADKADNSEIVHMKNTEPHALQDPGFKKCPDSYAAFSGSRSKNMTKRADKFYLEFMFFNSDIIYEEQGFADTFKNMTFNEKDPCSQIKIFFSSHSFSRAFIERKFDASVLQKVREEGRDSWYVKDGLPENGVLSLSTEVAPDNIGRLSTHAMKIKIDCKSGMTFSCGLFDSHCDLSRSIMAEFPDKECAVEGVDQVFSLYPYGQVRVNFQGTLKKTGEGTEHSDNLELKFSNVEWK